MIYIIVFIICAVGLFVHAIVYSIKISNDIKKGETGVRLYLTFASIVLSMFFVFIFTPALLYNYSFEKGVKLISKNNTDASIYLNNALRIRQILRPFDTFFDKRFFGLPPLFPSEMLTRRRLADSYRLNGHYQKALEEYEQVEFFYKNNFDVVAGMADSYFNLLNVEKTEYYYGNLIKTERDNKDVNYYFHMGMAYLILMDCNSAEMYFNKTIELGEDSNIINRLIEGCKDKRGQGVTQTSRVHSMHRIGTGLGSNRKRRLKSAESRE